MLALREYFDTVLTTSSLLYLSKHSLFIRLKFEDQWLHVLPFVRPLLQGLLRERVEPLLVLVNQSLSASGLLHLLAELHLGLLLPHLNLLAQVLLHLLRAQTGLLLLLVLSNM